MKELHIKNSLVCYDDWNIENKPELTAFIESQNLINIIESIDEDIIIVLGGDGTMLKIIGKYHNDGRAFLGINFGHRGFLLNHREWLHKDSSFITRLYPLLEVSQNNEIRGVGFNDINIYSPNGKAIELDVSREDIGKIYLKGDGVLVSTPAGSTGHSRSYRGPVTPHNSNQTIITPKGNLTDEMPKIIDGHGNALIIKNTGRKFPINVNIDGNMSFSSDYDEDISIEICRKPDRVKLLIIEQHEKDWDNKVTQAQGFR